MDRGISEEKWKLFFFLKTGNLEQKSATSKMENLLFELQRDE